MKVTFTRNFDWNPTYYGGRVTIAFRAGDQKTVTRECAAAALAAGAIEHVEVWPQEEPDHVRPADDIG